MITVKKAVLREKIYIEAKDIVNDRYTFEGAFTYEIGKDFFSTFEYNSLTDTYAIPSGSHYKLKITEVVDERQYPRLDYVLTNTATLRSDQEDVLQRLFKAKGRPTSGIIQAGCGWGKTYLGCAIVARANVKTLILVHTKLLFNQWIKELEGQIPGVKIGKIGAGFNNIEDITVGIYKSVNNRLDIIREQFGLLIVDEVHLCPANVFSQTVNGINTLVKIGISATPRRKDGKHVVLPDYFTSFHIVAEELVKKKIPAVRVIKTDFRIGIRNPAKDWVPQLTKLSTNTMYLYMIAKYAKMDVLNGRCILILADRLSMLTTLEKFIPESTRIVGEIKDEEREEILKEAGKKYKVILSNRIFDEGVSCHRLDTLYITCPENNPIKREQRIGRIQRDHPDKQPEIIRDFWFRGPFVERQQEARQQWYIQQGFKIYEEVPI